MIERFTDREIEYLRDRAERGGPKGLSMLDLRKLIDAYEAAVRYEETLRQIAAGGHAMVTDEIDGSPCDRCLPECDACAANESLEHHK